jgi:hypothetical protein
MKKRRIVLVLLLLVGACLIVGALFAPRPLKPGVSVENFNRLYVGMPAKKVTTILGRGPDSARADHADRYYVVWNTDDGMRLKITHWFDGSQAIESASLSIRDGTEETLQPNSASLFRQAADWFGF